MAGNVRTHEPGPVADLLIDHFDDLDEWEALRSDGTWVRDPWLQYPAAAKRKTPGNAGRFLVPCF